MLSRGTKLEDYIITFIFIDKFAKDLKAREDIIKSKIKPERWWRARTGNSLSSSTELCSLSLSRSFARNFKDVYQVQP